MRGDVLDQQAELQRALLRATMRCTAKAAGGGFSAAEAEDGAAMLLWHAMATCRHAACSPRRGLERCRQSAAESSLVAAADQQQCQPLHCARSTLV